MFLMLAEVFFQRVQVTGGLVNVFLRANHPNAARRLAEQRLGDHVGTIVQLIHRFQNGLTAGFLYTARPAQHP